MRVKYGDAPKKAAKKKSATRTPRDANSVERDKHRMRAHEVEMSNPDEHPVDQFYKGTQFHKRLMRPKSLAESLDDKPRSGKRLDNDLVDDIFRILREGLCEYHAEALLGLADRAIINWKTKAKRDKTKIKKWKKNVKSLKAEGLTADAAMAKAGDKPPETVHMNLAMKVREAEALGEVTIFGRLVDATLEGDTQTGRWILERRWPHLYGRYAQRRDLVVNVEKDGKATKGSLVSEFLGVITALEKIDESEDS